MHEVGALNRHEVHPRVILGAVHASDAVTHVVGHDLSHWLPHEELELGVELPLVPAGHLGEETNIDEGDSCFTLHTPLGILLPAS